MDVKHLIKDHACRNIPLNYDEAFWLGRYALRGCAGDILAQVQSITILAAIHNQATYAWQAPVHDMEHYGHRLPDDPAEQIAGVCAAIFQHDIAESEHGFLEPNIPWAMDNCGMGGDMVVTANVSTIAALIAATAGIPMCKHGSPANADKGRHGSSDFVSLLGINTFGEKHKVERCLEQAYFGYTEALDTRYKQIHMQTHRTAMLPHMNDIIGPITNPMQPKLMSRRVLGVNHLVSPATVAKAYHILNQKRVTTLEHGIFVRGLMTEDNMNGVDEVSICPGGTQVAELRGETITEHTWHAKDFGVDPIPPTSISPPTNMNKGEFSLALMNADMRGEAFRMVLANAAVLFYLAGRSTDLAECYRMAEEASSRDTLLSKVEEVRSILSC